MEFFNQIVPEKNLFLVDRPANLKPNREWREYCAHLASQLPPIADLDSSLNPDDFVFRGTLLHRLRFILKEDQLCISGNEPSEEMHVVPASIHYKIAAWYASSFSDDLAREADRIDPVLLAMPRGELEGGETTGIKWYIPKRQLSSITGIRLFFPGRSPQACLTENVLR